MHSTIAPEQTAAQEADLWLRERRWKVAQAKRFAKLVSKSNLDVEGRERSRRKEELLNVKKRAAWIAKEVLFLYLLVLFLFSSSSSSVTQHCVWLHPGVQRLLYCMHHVSCWLNLYSAIPTYVPHNSPVG